MSYSKVKKEVDRWAIQRELVVSSGLVVKFNDQTNLLDNPVPLAQSDKNFDLAFAMGEKMFADWKYGTYTRPF